MSDRIPAFVMFFTDFSNNHPDIKSEDKFLSVKLWATKWLSKLFSELLILAVYLPDAWSNSKYPFISVAKMLLNLYAIFASSRILVYVAGIQPRERQRFQCIGT